MGTAEIETRGNAILALAEELRQRRALKYGLPNGDQSIPAELLDTAILTLVSVSYDAQHITAADVQRFYEGWRGG